MKMKVRRYLLEQIHRDIKTVEKIQKHRTTCRDYFFWFSGLLGTHHFYLICLPTLFWFKSGITVSYPNNQQEDLARVFSRGVIAILALGCYCTGVLKDYFCLPRPHSENITHIVEHHATVQEYGFPSTHSAHAISLVVYSSIFFVNELSTSRLSSIAFCTLASLYGINVSFSRVYTGVHSFVDIIGGAVIGLILGLLVFIGSPFVGTWLMSGDPSIIFTMTSLMFLLIFIHPDPKDACPCFLDSQSFLGALTGCFIGNSRYRPHPSLSNEGEELVSILLIGALKFVIGFIVIGIWRSSMKPLSLEILSRIFVNTPVDIEEHSVDSISSNVNYSPKSKKKVMLPPHKMPRFDAEVLTKAIVYIGIGWIACESIPLLFDSIF